MSEQRDIILIIDDEADTRTLLREQVFSAPTFEVIEAKDGPAALQWLQGHRPDLIVIDMKLPGLTGLDMLVAINAQKFRGPIIVMEDSSEKRSAVEAFRLGATDYVTKPIREPEVLAAVERGLAEIRLRRQRDDLIAKLQTTNRELESRVKELTTLYEIGESVTAMRQLEELFSRVLNGALTVTGADHSLLLLRDEKTGLLILRAGKNLHPVMQEQIGKTIQNQLADLVMTSREVMAVGRDGLRQFTLDQDLHAVVYVPMTVKSSAIGILAVGNHQTEQPFTDDHSRLLKILADYAAIAIVNTRLMDMLEKRRRTMEEELRQRDAVRARQVQTVMGRLQVALTSIETELTQVVENSASDSPDVTRQRLQGLVRQVHQLADQVVNLKPP
ncbi:MAG: response regulator [Anaerolineae bacterium]|nr:response regulator [Anaerolineae bacterium]